MDTSYRTRTDGNTPNLDEVHRRMLYDESGISPEVVAERGVRTVRSGRELPKVYSRKQKERAPGLFFPVSRPNGESSHVFRPDKPDPEKPGCKYLQAPKDRGGDGNVLDVLERHKIGDMHIPVIFTEGVKKADSITSAARREGIEIVAAAIAGVWNYLSGGEPIPDMYEIPVEDREVHVCYDSDMLRKPEVMMAEERLAEWLAGRGAKVKIVYLPDQPDGSKTGADDFLAAGGTLEGLLGRSRPFDPQDLQREKLSRNEGLRRGLDHLTRREAEMPAKTMRDCSKRSTYRGLLTLAEKYGKLVGDGVEVVAPSMTVAELAAVSQPTASKCLRALVEDGDLRRIERKRSEQADSYVLLVPRGVLLYNYGGPRGTEEPQEGAEGGEMSRGYNAVPPLTEQRWSTPSRKGRRGVAEGTRRVRQARSLSEDEPPVRRPGKKRREIVTYLVENGGSATREELLEAFGGPQTQWRDFKKQTLADLLGRRRRYKGEELSVGPPVVELDEDGIHLVEGWREALEQHREIGGEEEAAIRQKVNHLRQRAGFRNRHKVQPDPHPANAHADGWTEDLEKLPEPPSAEALYGLIGRRVDTVRGRGELWDVKGGEARVVLDSDPSRWVALDLAELLLEVPDA